MIGCGALGLTSAILAQRAGARVTIYARSSCRDTTSARATGDMDARFAHRARQCRGPDFAAVWEEMARTSFKTHRDYLGLPGTPVEWIDQYVGFRRRRRAAAGGAPAAAERAAARRLRQLRATASRSDAEMAASAGRRDAVQGGGGLRAARS